MMKTECRFVAFFFILIWFWFSVFSATKFILVGQGFWDPIAMSTEARKSLLYAFHIFGILSLPLWKIRHYILLKPED